MRNPADQGIEAARRDVEQEAFRHEVVEDVRAIWRIVSRDLESCEAVGRVLFALERVTRKLQG